MFLLFALKTRNKYKVVEEDKLPMGKNITLPRPYGFAEDVCHKGVETVLKL